LEASDNGNNQLVTASKAGSGWQESVDNHLPTTASNDKQLEHVVDDDGIEKEGKSGDGDDDGD
jgi:hypothetical protein